MRRRKLISNRVPQRFTSITEPSCAEEKEAGLAVEEERVGLLGA